MATGHSISFGVSRARLPVIGLPAYLVYSGQASFADLRHPVTNYRDKPKRHSWLSGPMIENERI